jgi:hypothetical protein
VGGGANRQAREDNARLTVSYATAGEQERLSLASTWHRLAQLQEGGHERHLETKSEAEQHAKENMDARRGHDQATGITDADVAEKCRENRSPDTIAWTTREARRAETTTTSAAIPSILAGTTAAFAGLRSCLRSST